MVFIELSLALQIQIVRSEQMGIVIVRHHDKCTLMNFHSCLALAGAILIELLGTLFLQASHHFSRPVSTAGTVLCYAIATYLFSFALKTIPVGVAYAAWSGLGIALATGASFLLLKQKIEFPALLGIAFIALGSVLIVGFSQSKFD